MQEDEILQHLKNNTAEQIAFFLKDRKLTSDQLIQVCKNKGFSDSEKINSIATKYRLSEKDFV